jgi:hypothetical protein
MHDSSSFIEPSVDCFPEDKAESSLQNVVF